jgi:ubiquinone/menaquinone biosynthesis C-methylase UbiE
MRQFKKENTAVIAHRKFVMKRRVRQISRLISLLIPEEVSTMLDVGAGTGEMAKAIGVFRPDLMITGVDIYARPRTLIPIIKYDGYRLPFGDSSTDAVAIIDVLHHCSNQVGVLNECVRVSKKWVIIKDHVSENIIDKLTLSFMDWIGNKAHGVALSYNYLSSYRWTETFIEVGLHTVKHIKQLNLYPMPFDNIFGRSLHCLYLLKKD